MPPKDTIFNGRPCEIFFAPIDSSTEFSSLGVVIADSLSYEADNEPTESISAPTADKYEFAIGDVRIDSGFTSKFLGEASKKLGTFSVIVQTGKEYIYRPKNLKYPNKKRARRIWKKWRRRFGAYYPEQMVLPNCTMTTEARGDDLYTKITAQL